MMQSFSWLVDLLVLGPSSALLLSKFSAQFSVRCTLSFFGQIIISGAFMFLVTEPNEC